MHALWQCIKFQFWRDELFETSYNWSEGGGEGGEEKTMLHCSDQKKSSNASYAISSLLPKLSPELFPELLPELLPGVEVGVEVEGEGGGRVGDGVGDERGQAYFERRTVF